MSARFHRRRSQVVVALNGGIELTFPAPLAEGLAHVSPDKLARIEISSVDSRLQWPKLDVHFYVPALLQSVFGSKQWVARQLSAKGRPPRTAFEVAAARE